MREIFPNYPASVVREDISMTRSVEQTIDNIVEGRLVIPEVGLVFVREFMDIIKQAVISYFYCCQGKAIQLFLLLHLLYIYHINKPLMLSRA